jgi:gamma-tubulin complex component 3
MLRQWVYDGELLDPHKEFFVFEQDLRIEEVNADGGRSRGGAMSVWQDKYKLDEDMIPSIITKEFANKVFLIGKSLNFIRYGCGDSLWVQEYSKEASKDLHYGDTASLEASIDEAYKTTMARLIHLMGDKFKLFVHLRALKDYLLLGNGDFIALLMQSLSKSLDKPSGAQYRHTLTAQLEHAIRSSIAQYDLPDVLRRLDARMLELSHGDIGWDVFTLDYKVDAPVDVIVTPWGNKQYLKVFNFLWRIKRVEFALASAWRRAIIGARGLKSVLATVEDRFGADWKTARCVISEMIHFVDQLQYYILFEVIESSWDELQVAIHKPNITLDDLISAHDKYLRAITHKGLLGSGRASTTGSREDSFLSQLAKILKIMLAYKETLDGLWSFSVAESSRREQMRARIDNRTAAGQWGITEADEEDTPLSTPIMSGRNLRKDLDSSVNTPLDVLPGLLDGGNLSDEELLPTLRERLKILAADYRSTVCVLLGDLATQKDVDMRFLGVVMNYNDVYEVKKRGEKDKDERERDRQKEKDRERERLREKRERREKEKGKREKLKERERVKEREKLKSPEGRMSRDMEMETRE